MKLARPQLEIKTQISQQSNIDVFSKLEVSFLEKFFNYNLTDYFSQTFSNVYEDLLERKVANKNQKMISSNLFIINKSFLIEEVQGKIDNFYRSKSKSIQDNDLPFAFKFQYCNRNPIPNLMGQGELLLVDVKIKAQVQKMEEYPQKIIKNLQYFRGEKRKNLSKFQKLLADYKSQYLNVFVVYFGDCNFNYFNKDKYQVQTVKLLGKTFKLKIFVFYVSKQALVESFRVINRINNIQYINDLQIQFYELRRQKKGRKRRRQLQMIKKQRKGQNIFSLYNIFLGTFGILFVGFAFGIIYIKKFKK